LERCFWALNDRVDKVYETAHSSPSAIACLASPTVSETTGITLQVDRSMPGNKGTRVLQAWPNGGTIFTLHPKPSATREVIADGSQSPKHLNHKILRFLTHG
jgi:hypothetical protein